MSSGCVQSMAGDDSGGKAPSPRTLEVGQRLQGRYELVAALSEGGMGAVYKARDLKKRGAWVAVKRMRLMTGDEEVHRELVTRKFQEEVEMLRRLDCPGIPRLVDAFEHDGLPCIVMDFVEGQNLEQQLLEVQSSTAGALPEQQAAEMAVQICGLLEHLHGQEPEPVIHRDIKPANLILGERDGRYYLVDFGLTRGLGGLSTKTLVGTVAYAPLEQFQGHPEPRSDQYSLGATLHHLLSGQPPVPFAVPPLREVQPAVHPRLAEIVTRATARDPADRYASITEMKEALLELPQQWAEPRRPASPPLCAPAPTASQDRTEPSSPPDGGLDSPAGAPPAERPGGWPFWARLPVRVLCLLCLIAAAASLFAAWEGSRRIDLAFQAFESPALARSEWRCLASRGLSRVPVGIAMEPPSGSVRSGAVFERTGDRPIRACRFRLQTRGGQASVLLFCGKAGVLFEDDRVANGYRARPVAVTVPDLEGANLLNFVSYQGSSPGELLPEGYAATTFELRLEPDRMALYLEPEAAPPRRFLQAPLEAFAWPGPQRLGFLLPFPERHRCTVEIGQVAEP